MLGLRDWDTAAADLVTLCVVFFVRAKPNGERSSAMEPKMKKNLRKERNQSKRHLEA